MSNWHQFGVRHRELAEASVDLRDLYKQTYRWLKAEAKGKWKISRLKPTGVRPLPIRAFLKFTPIPGDTLIVSIKKERDVALFKMFFSDFYHPRAAGTDLTRVILPMMRRVMPNLLAQSIIGVQPMTGTPAALHVLKARYSDQSISNNVFYGKGSPSQRRAQRKRLRRKGVVFTGIQMAKPKAAMKSTLDTMLELTKRELLRGR